MRSSAPPLQFTSLMRNPPTDILLRGNYANSIPVILNSSLSSNTVLSRSCPPTQSRPPTPNSVTLLHLIAEPFPSPSSRPRRNPPPASPLRGKSSQERPNIQFPPVSAVPPSICAVAVPPRCLAPPFHGDLSLAPPLHGDPPAELYQVLSQSQSPSHPPRTWPKAGTLWTHT